ncbi:hypothetical protein [Roseimicrobium sp. ORNL1]|uniref:hypothetical protein n=1 Tax=Roseimicrobium sp. ORNL1 TaxID=2711231 RepID=UPI0013E1C326|nr:hypothetical protein [Roseimicrobium sp. ORNL1]QIF02078.1 hypothetical protein G5S37_11220 [Roseimicrobium sp. ORNL1]
MKVIVDSVEEGHRHGLSKEDIRVLWPLIPQPWRECVKAVRLSNSLHSAIAAEYVSQSKRLNIYSRGKSREEVIWSIFAELLLHYSMTHPTLLQKISKAQTAKIDSEIAPMVAAVLKELREVAQAKSMDFDPLDYERLTARWDAAKKRATSE